jgi:hypothetical protein
VKKGKPALIYFSSTPVVLDSIDLGQYAALKEFKGLLLQRGLCEEYQDLTEFKDKLWPTCAAALVPVPQ